MHPDHEDASLFLFTQRPMSARRGLPAPTAAVRSAMSSHQQTLQQGWKIHQSGDVQQAMRLYRSVIDGDSNDADAWVYLGMALFDQHQYEQSADAYRRAIAIEEQFPIAWNNLGNSLRMLGETDQSDACFQRALDQKPNYLSALKNRGTLWIWSGQIERGLAWYQRGLDVDPGNAELHRNLGVIHLLLGNYDTGWDEYRWRWKMPGMRRPRLSAPVWSGQPLNNQSFLLYAEQGLGDSIQFVRVAALLAERGARVVLQCPQKLIPLYSSVAGVDRLHIETASPPAVDYHASMIEVIDVIYQQTGEIAWGTDCFDSAGRYLTVSTELIDYWDRWLNQKCKAKRRIGINWQGNPNHEADVYRSMPLDVLRPLTELPGVDLISLQFGFGSEQVDRCGLSDSILQLPDHVDSDGGAFTDTAAILHELDHVVTTDTSVAHLAGAVGANVCLLLGRVPDWRWLTEGDTTRWYPTMQLVRQREFGDWDNVVERTRSILMR